MWPESIFSINTDHCGSAAASPTLVRRRTALCIGFPPIPCLISFGPHSSFLDHTSKLNCSHTKLWERGTQAQTLGTGNGLSGELPAQVHPGCCKWQNSILSMVEKYSIVYLPIYLTFSLSVHLLMDT